MDSLALIHRLHEHRSHVNRPPLDAAYGLGEEELRRSFDIGQGGPLADADAPLPGRCAWPGALLGDPGAVPPAICRENYRAAGLPGSQKGEGGVRSIAGLRTGWEELEGRWQAYLGGLTPEILDETMYRVSTSSGAGPDADHPSPLTPREQLVSAIASEPPYHRLPPSLLPSYSR
ncbi:MAG TPA: hypothetical protein VF170_01060 [Planctomycetaceae bacterium]